MELEFIRIGYMDSRFEKSMKPLTADVLEQLTWSEKVCQTMERIKATNDQEEKNRLKQQLPVVLFNCQMTENGERPSAENKLGVPSGFCLHDWDHMPESPRVFYIKNIAGYERELDIVLAHITPRGEGLRLVTELKDGERIPECQARLAAQFGMEQFADQKVKDITRLSYLPSKDYMMYVDKERLFKKKKTQRTYPTFSPRLIKPRLREPAAECGRESQPQRPEVQYDHRGFAQATGHSGESGRGRA